MKTYVLYTTSKSKFVTDQANIFVSKISETKGRGEVKIEVRFKIPKKVDLIKDSEGYIRPSWDWFKTQFPKENFDGVIFHFTPYYKTKWGLKNPKTKNWGGSRNSSSTDYPEFWVCDDLNPIQALGYPVWVNDFIRKLFHEHAHYDEDVDDKNGNVLTQDSVHTTDYKLKKIHEYHLLVDYRGKAFKEAVNRIMADVIKLAKKII